MQIKKNDFIEIEFTGKSNNEIFDTTNPEEAKSIGLDVNVKPMVISVGNEMLLKGLDEALEGKEIGKKYSVHITPDKAFGSRNASLIKTIPIRVFHEKEMNPAPGMVFQLDQHLVRILSVSGGRVIADFNNPLAGKEIDYDFKILRKVDDDKDKINAIQDFFFRQRFEFNIDENNKKVIFKEFKIKPIIDVFKDKFKALSGFDIEVEEKKEPKKGEAEEKKEKGEKEVKENKTEKKETKEEKPKEEKKINNKEQI